MRRAVRMRWNTRERGGEDENDEGGIKDVRGEYERWVKSRRDESGIKRHERGMREMRERDERRETKVCDVNNFRMELQ